jgi:hypothetical protein
MDLIIINPNKIVQNAFTRESDLSFSLIINTVEKWVTFDLSGGDDSHYTWYYYSSDDTPDTVTLVPEDDEDIDVINRLRFELHDKDQLWILFPIEGVY